MCLVQTILLQEPFVGKWALSIWCGISSPNVEGNPRVFSNPAKENRLFSLLHSHGQRPLSSLTTDNLRASPLPMPKLTHLILEVQWPPGSPTKMAESAFDSSGYQEGEIRADSVCLFLSDTLCCSSSGCPRELRLPWEV